MRKMKVKLYSVEDVKDFVNIMGSIEGEYFFAAEDGVARFLDRNPDTCFVAESDGELVGVIMAGNDGRRGYIYHTAVHPSCRTQGIGSTLVHTSLDALKRCGISKVALVVFEKNTSGNAFWEKQGFTVRNDLTYRNKSLIEMVRIDT